MATHFGVNVFIFLKEVFFYEGRLSLFVCKWRLATQSMTCMSLARLGHSFRFGLSCRLYFGILRGRCFCSANLGLIKKSGPSTLKKYRRGNFNVASKSLMGLLGFPRLNQNGVNNGDVFGCHFGTFVDSPNTMANV